MDTNSREKSTNPPLGINIRGNSIRIMFYFNSVRCYETVATGNSKANINYAIRRRAEILRKIEDGEFDYRIEFPNSNNIKKFYHTYNFTCGDLLLKQIEIYKQTADIGGKKAITFKTYYRIIQSKLMPYFKDILIANLTSLDIRKFVQNLCCSAKTAQQQIIPLRAMIEEALNEGIITINPLNQLALNKLINSSFSKSTYERERFTEYERELIISSCSDPMFKLMITIEFFTGLRIGELIALRWQDVRQDHIIIVENQVKGETTTPKTLAGCREVILLPRAKTAFIELHKITGDYEHVFISNQTKRNWRSSDALQKRWVKLLAKAGVKYRNPYLMRHTFAHMLLDKGENILWVANQLGHRDTEMVIKTYAGTTKRLDYKLKGEY